MELIVTVPETYPAEREYILFVILKEFLGLNYVIQRSGKADTYISDKEKKCNLIIPDILFATPEEKWLGQSSLPKQPLEIWDPGTIDVAGSNGYEFSPVPVIYGVCKAHFGEMHASANSQPGLHLMLPIDIFGSCFFMLTRYEEIVKKDRDEHGRFPTKTSLAYQAGFFDRPIVNEYLEILWASLTKMWPLLKRKKREFRLRMSHDVDEICSVVGKPIRQIIRRIGGDIIVRQAPLLAIRTMHAALSNRPEKDPCDTFDFIMDQSEKFGITSTFNCMSDLGHSEYDQRYEIDHPWVRHCLRRIIERGHLIGFHPTYGSYLNAERIKSEFIRVKKTAEEEGAEQNEWGGRQHYLRFQNPTTWQHWEDAGLNYDSTVGFVDIIGFRAGCSYEYPVFNLHKRRKLKLLERPLIVMDKNVLSANGKVDGATGNKISDISLLCKKVCGDFTMLWHNGRVISREEKKSYIAAIESLI